MRDYYPKSRRLRGYSGHGTMPPAPMSVTDPIRQRLRERLSDKGISQSKLCRLLSEQTGRPWLLQRMGKVLNGHIELRVEDLLLMCQVAQISPVDLFRDPAREFVADLTPSELRLIHTLRDQPEIAQPLLDLIRRLTPAKRPTSRAILRARMRRMKTDEGA